MAQTRLVGLILCCLLATTGWAATSSPSLIATPPQPKWSELTVQQKIVLAPLSDDWDSLVYYRQKKWLSIVARFPTMTPEEQHRVQGQMQKWGKLSSEQRQLAREKFKTANRLPVEKREEFKKKWAEYSSLPEEEKEKFKQQMTSKPVPKAGRPVSAAPVLATPALPDPAGSQPAAQTAPSSAVQTAADSKP
jgi:hypothetical protein